MKKTHHKNLGIILIITLILGVCFHFSKNMNFASITNVAHGATSLESTSDGVTTPVTTTSADDKISADISFLTNLTSLGNIKIDTSFFKDKAFVSLKDNRVIINKVEPGRINPFAPIENVSVDTTIPVSKVITGNGTQITDKTAVLNGTINVVDGVTDLYFEYGKTETLGTVTETIKPSLVGSFIKNILGLTPKTNYFFRSCAKINSVANCGEIISFSTK